MSSSPKSVAPIFIRARFTQSNFLVYLNQLPRHVDESPVDERIMKTIRAFYFLQDASSDVDRTRDVILEIDSGSCPALTHPS